MWKRKLEAIKFLWKQKHFEERSWKQTRKRLTFYGAGSGSKNILLLPHSWLKNKSCHFRTSAKKANLITIFLFTNFKKSILIHFQKNQLPTHRLHSYPIPTDIRYQEIHLLFVQGWHVARLHIACTEISQHSAIKQVLLMNNEVLI